MRGGERHPARARVRAREAAFRRSGKAPVIRDIHAPPPVQRRFSGAALESGAPLALEATALTAAGRPDSPLGMAGRRLLMKVLTAALAAHPGAGRARAAVAAAAGARRRARSTSAATSATRSPRCRPRRPASTAPPRTAALAAARAAARGADARYARRPLPVRDRPRPRRRGRCRRRRSTRWSRAASPRRTSCRPCSPTRPARAYSAGDFERTDRLLARIVESQPNNPARSPITASSSARQPRDRGAPTGQRGRPVRSARIAANRRPAGSPRAGTGARSRRL